jgi:hypothetical protein
MNSYLLTKEKLNSTFSQILLIMNMCNYFFVGNRKKNVLLTTGKLLIYTKKITRSFTE